MDRFAYGSTRRTGRDVDIYVINPADPKSDRLLAPLSGGGWAALDWSPDDRQILVGEYVSINESYLWLVDAASGDKTLLTPKGGAEKVAYWESKFRKDGKGIYAITDRDAEFLRLASIDLASKQHTFLTQAIPWDVEGFDLTRDGKTIAFTTNEAGIGTLHLLDAARGKEIAVPQLPPGSVSGLKWHANGRELGFGLVSARSPLDVFSLDLPTGKVERWTHSETGGLNTSALPRTGTHSLEEL